MGGGTGKGQVYGGVSDHIQLTCRWPKVRGQRTTPCIGARGCSQLQIVEGQLLPFITQAAGEQLAGDTIKAGIDCAQVGGIDRIGGWTYGGEGPRRAAVGFMRPRQNRLEIVKLETVQPAPEVQGIQETHAAKTGIIPGIDQFAGGRSLPILMPPVQLLECQSVVFQEKFRAQTGEGYLVKFAISSSHGTRKSQAAIPHT
ncbi:hypothetical protein ES703_102191 [subsurface metagenome]